MKIPRKLWIVLGAVVALILIVLIVVPLFIDVNRYRDVIESKAEEVLGREVSLGEMSLSLLPIAVSVEDLAVGALPEEGGGDLMTARRLRVGARLFPLLGGRLEVTSATVEGPEVSLVRGADGTWNVQRLVATDAAAEPETESGEGAAEFRVDTLRITEGRIAVRDLSRGGEPLEVTLADLDLRLDDFAPDELLEFTLSAIWEEVPGSSVELAGKVGPLAPEEGEPFVVDGTMNVTGLDVDRALQTLGEFVALPAGVAGGTGVSLAAGIDASFGETSRIAVSDVLVDGLELSVRRGATGTWNLPVEPAPGEAAEPSPASPTEFTLSGLTVRNVRLRYEDASGPGDPISLTVDDLEITLDRLPEDGPANLQMRGVLDESGKLGIEGTVGPVEEESTPLDLRVTLDPVPPAAFRILSGEGFALDTDAGSASIDVALSGSLPENLRIQGTAEVSGFEARITGTEGQPRTVLLNADAEYDIVVESGGEGVQVDRLALDFSGNRLALEGSIRRESDTLTRLDVRLLPCRVKADDLSGLLALAAGDLPVSFASTSPIEVEARVHGLVGEGTLPQMSGKANLQGFDFMHASLEKPLTGVGARITLDGERVEVAGLNGAVGTSDFSGDVTLEGFESPRVRFTLHSRNADFGEMFSFLSTGEEGAPEAVEEEEVAGETALDRLSLDGDIRIDRGAFDTLKFTDLEAHMTWADNVLTLKPVQMTLYDGTFRGAVTSDMRGDEPVFDVRGDAAGVDLDAFIGENLGAPGVLYGRFHGKVETRTEGADYESIVRGLKGSGTVEVLEGRLGGLDILETLSKVSGFFGESTLQSLSGQMAAEGTEFRTMKGGVRFDGGRMGFQDLAVDSPFFNLQGIGSVDMLKAALDGDFRLSLSPELSESMRAEGSRPGNLFWNPRTKRVEVPFRLSGPFAEPSPSVDWDAVADAALKGRAEDEVRDWVSERLGLKRDEEPEPAPAPPKPVAPAEPVEAAPAEAGTTQVQPIRIEITEARMGGNFLTPDLKVNGLVEGKRIGYVEISVVDAAGREIRAAERLKGVDEALSKKQRRGARHRIPWWYELDGKEIVGAEHPLTVTVTAFKMGGTPFRKAVQVSR